MLAGGLDAWVALLPSDIEVTPLLPAAIALASSASIMSLHANPTSGQL